MPTAQEYMLPVWQGKFHAKVHVAGRGPALVYLHGVWGLCWDSFLDRLAEHYTVYAVQHPGTNTDEPNAIHELTGIHDLVIFYNEVLDGLKLESAAVVGHSFGGMIACEWAATNPERISRLVLVAPLGLWRDDLPVTNWVMVSPKTLPQVLFNDPSGETAQRMFGIPADPMEAAHARGRLLWSQACVDKFVWPIPDKGLKNRIHRATAPTLLIWGENDRLVPPVYAQEFANRLSNATVAMVEKGSHHVHAEQPDVVVRQIENFLQS